MKIYNCLTVLYWFFLFIIYYLCIFFLFRVYYFDDIDFYGGRENIWEFE